MRSSDHETLRDGIPAVVLRVAFAVCVCMSDGLVLAATPLADDDTVDVVVHAVSDSAPVVVSVAVADNDALHFAAAPLSSTPPPTTGT